MHADLGQTSFEVWTRKCSSAVTRMSVKYSLGYHKPPLSFALINEESFPTGSITCRESSNAINSSFSSLTFLFLEDCLLNFLHRLRKMYPPR